MTKAVRIENADMAEYDVIVEVFEQMSDDPNAEWVLKDTKVLSYPTQMITEHLWDGRKLVITEQKKQKASF